MSGAVDDPVEIDGARGEGGGQILRTSLALSLITGRPVMFQRLRANRAKPGLARQHLACVEAAAAVGDAEVRGAHVGSTALWFSPRGLRAGDWTFRIGTAGSTSLVLQTVLVPLLAAPGPSRVVVEGGTHNDKAPPAEFLARAYLPALRRMGAAVTFALDRHGFYPAGGGRIVATIEPSTLAGVSLVEAGAVRSIDVRAIVARLPLSIATRELAEVKARLGAHKAAFTADEVASPGPGNAVLVTIERASGAEVTSAFGARGVPAERVAAAAADEAAAYLAADVPVGAHLADQLMLPMAVARAGRYRTLPLTLHSTTNLDTIARFLDVPVAVTDAPGGVELAFG